MAPHTYGDPLTFLRSIPGIAGKLMSMSRGLETTAALITGASSGIGAATAEELAAHGARVAVLARRRDRLDELATRIRDSGGEVLVLEGDVTDEASVRSAVEQTVAMFGRLDTVVAKAGVMLLGPIEDAPVSEWERMVDLNLKGLLYTAHAALPHLLKAVETGRRQVADLVLVSSVAGRVARNGCGVYNLTKHRVGAFGESLRQEVTKRHVRVSVVEPGAVATELMEQNRPEIQQAAGERFAGVERMEAADLADAIGYIVTRPRRVAINEILIRPTEQEA